MRYFIFRPTYDPVEQFNFDKDLAKLEPFAQDEDAVNPDLSAFKAHGGKLILYHGWADHSITPVRTIEYYASVIDMMSNAPGDPGKKTPTKSLTLRAFSWCPGCTIAEAVLAPPVSARRIRAFPRSLTRSTTLSWRWIAGLKPASAPDKIIASASDQQSCRPHAPALPLPAGGVYSGSGDVNPPKAIAANRMISGGVLRIFRA